MSNINNFKIDTDYTALKHRPEMYTASVNVPAGTVSDSQQWSSTVSVPSGSYTIVSHLTLNGTTYTPHFGVDITASSLLAGTFLRLNSTTIQLLVEVDVSGGGSDTIGAQTVTGSFVLVPSPT